jgi:hypothetical protein
MRIRRGKLCCTHGRDEKCIQIFCRKNIEGKIPLGRPTHRCEDNIRKDFRGIGLDIVDWIHPAQDRDQCLTSLNTAMYFGVP